MKCQLPSRIGASCQNATFLRGLKELVLTMKRLKGTLTLPWTWRIEAFHLFMSFMVDSLVWRLPKPFMVRSVQSHSSVDRRPEVPTNCRTGQSSLTPERSHTLVLFAHHVWGPVLIDPFVQPTKQDRGTCEPCIAQRLIGSNRNVAGIVIQDDLGFMRNAIEPLRQLRG